jgi:predicted PurR-regulated permease PerM
MSQLDSTQQAAGKPARFSYYFMLLVLALVVGLRLATPLLGALFTYLALTRLAFFKRGRKWLAVGIFLILLAGMTYAVGYVINQTVRALPEIAENSIPAIIAWAKQHGIELPFTDYDSLRDQALDIVKGEVRYLADFVKFARGAAAQILYLAAGCIVAISIYLDPRFELGLEPGVAPDNLYSICCEEVARRFSTLYQSFVTVMGAQIVISAINTFLTAIFVLTMRLAHGVVVIGVTFLCGLLPVVGNLLSNTVVVMIAFTVTPQRALAALVFLVVIHKLEYFLNSKIVGWRIRNPLWLTLLGLIVGERLLGVPGMILAPVVLNYLKVEASRVGPGAWRRQPSALASV